MIGAFKCCGVGSRVIRNLTPPATASVAEFGENGCGTLNWSQKRFLRSIPPSASSPGNVNAQFVVNEIENQQRKRLADSGNLMPSAKKSLSKEKYRRSIRGHQLHLSNLLPNTTELGKRDNQIAANMYKIIIENGAPTVRVKNGKDDVLVKEWIGIQNELQIIKRDRIEEDKRKLQIAGQQALREMEASLRKGMNLEDLDQAIEGALCSELKDEYSQQKSSHDN